MTDRPYSKRIILPEHIPPNKVADWHAFLATLPPAWWEGKSPEERGREADKRVESESSWEDGEYICRFTRSRRPLPKPPEAQDVS